MTDSQQKHNPLNPQSQENPPSQTPQEARTKGEAQVDLMGSAAVDPLPLVDEEKDPIAQEIKQSSQSD